MASTTTNLGLTKPAYSDDADISDINGNMDLIDAEAGKVRANVAANYDSSETYAVGDYCLHDGSLYKCSTAISSPEAWTAGHWTQIKITGELSTLNGKIHTGTMVKTFTNGKTNFPFSDMGLSSRPDAIILTPQSQYGSMLYEYGNSSSEIVISGKKMDNTDFSGDVRFGYIVIQ